MVKRYLVLYILVVVVAGCFPASVKAEEGLAGWWKFDEGSGDILHDSSGKGNNGKIYGATWVKDKTGSALLFDAKDDYIDCGNDVSLQIDGPLTISTWVTVSSETSGRWQIVSKHCWQLGLKHGDVPDIRPVLEFRNADGDGWLDIQHGAGIPKNEWVYIVGVWSIEDKKMSLYVDGELVATDKWLEGAIYGFNQFNLSIGRDAGMGSHHTGIKGGYFSGLISETKIYNRVLSSEEVKNKYQLELKTKDESISVPVLKEQIHM